MMRLTALRDDIGSALYTSHPVVGLSSVYMQHHKFTTHPAPRLRPSKSHRCALQATSSVRSSRRNSHLRNSASLVSSSQVLFGHLEPRQILPFEMLSGFALSRLDRRSEPSQSFAADPLCFHPRTDYTAAAKAPPRFREAVCLRETQRTDTRLVVGPQNCSYRQYQDPPDRSAASARNAAAKT
jgi:hypothetical protein